MGYSYHLYQMNRSLFEEISVMNINELTETYGEDDWFYLGHLPMKKLHSNGDLDFDEVSHIKSMGKPLFSDDSLKNTEEMDSFIIGKEGLEAVISIYKERVVRYLKKLTVSEEYDEEHLSSEERRKLYIESLLREWEENPPYRLNNDYRVVTSGRYEYMVFELVHLYKTIDFENNVIVFCGH